MDNIMVLLQNAVIVLCIFVFGTKLFNKKIIICLWLMNSIIQIILQTFLDSRMVLLSYLLCILVLFIHTKNVFTTLSYPFITWGLSILSESIFFLLLMTVIDESYTAAGAIVFQNRLQFLPVLFYTVSQLLLLLLCYLIFSAFHSSGYNKSLKYSKAQKFFFVVFLFITVLVFYQDIVLHQMLDIIYQPIQSRLIILFLYAFLLIVLFIWINKTTRKNDYLLYQEQILQNEKKTLENLQLHAHYLEENHKKTIALHHDLKNIFLGLSNHIQKDDMKSLKAFFNNHIEPLFQEIRDGVPHYRLLSNVLNDELRGLFAAKLHLGDEFSVNIHVEITKPILIEKHNIIEICRLLGILLDNALEEAIECNKPYLRITAWSDNLGNNFCIANSCRDDLPMRRELFQKGFSTKGEGRGLGLAIASEMIRKNQKLDLRTSVKDNFFYQSLSISK